MIRILNAYKSFGSTPIFKDIQLVIEQPGLYIIQGESGTGKSTLLNMIAGYETFDAGKIEINHNLTTIFQNYELISELNILDNILLGKDKSEEFNRLLEQLDIHDLTVHYPDELSGGQKQRVGIVRALLMNPNIILCDEPTEALDIDNKVIVMNLLKQMSKTKIILVASHDQKMIDEYADEVIRIRDYKLIRETEYKTEEIITTHEMMISSNKKQFQLIHKIISRNTLIYSLIITIMLLTIQGLFLFEKKMFYYLDTTRTVNADILYLDANSRDVELSSLVEVEKLQPIIKIKQPDLNHQGYRVNVVPYAENECEIIKGREPKKGEIIINQHVAEQLNAEIGKEIKFTYMLASFQHELSLTICGIIEEADNESMNIYYDYDSLLEILDERKLQSGHSHRKYLLEYGSYYQINVGYENMEEIYEKAQGIKRVFLSNSLYDQKLAFMNHQAVYKMLFTTFEIILIAGSIAFIVISTQKETKRYLLTSAILTSMQFTLKQVKRDYIKIKLMYFVPMIIIGTNFIFVLFMKIMDGKLYIHAKDIRIILIMIIAIYVIYALALFVTINQLKQEKISQILKDSKDA